MTVQQGRDALGLNVRWGFVADFLQGFEQGRGEAHVAESGQRFGGGHVGNACGC